MSSLFQDIANQKYELKDKTKSKNITPEEKTVAVREKMDNLIALGKNKQPTVSARSTTSTNLSNMTNSLMPEKMTYSTSNVNNTQSDKKTSVTDKILNTVKTVNSPVMNEVQKKYALENAKKDADNIRNQANEESVVSFGGKEVPKSEYYIENATLTSPEIMYRDLSLIDKIGTIPKRTAKTVKNLAGNALYGALSGAEGIAKEGIALVGRGAERLTRDYTLDNSTNKSGRISDNVEQILLGKPTDTSEKIRKETEELVKTNYVAEERDKMNKNDNAGITGKYNPKVLGVPAEDIANEAGRMYFLGPMKMLGFGASAAGSATSEALNDGEALDSALKYGAVTGTVEAATEQMFDTFNILGGGRLDKYLPKSAIGKFITGSLGEGVEEMVSEAINPFSKMVTYEGNVDNPFSSSENAKEYFTDIGKAGWQGFVMGMFMQGMHDVSDAEIRQEYKKEVSQAIDKLSNLTNQQKIELKNELSNIADNSEIQLSTVQKYLAENSNHSQYIMQNNNLSSDITYQNANKPKTLEELIPTGKNVTQNGTQNVQRKQVDKTNQAESKTVLSANMEQSKQDLIKDVKNNKYLNEQEKKSFIDTINEIEYTEEVEKDVRRTMNVFEEERGLKNITNNFNETKPTYNKYAKDNVEYDKQYIDLAKDSVKANNSGKRTKEQWLQVAKNLGNQIYEMSDAEVEKQAFKSWIDNRPNNANALNRQGKKYVKFTMDEWVNQVYDTVREARKNVPQQVVENKAPQIATEKAQNKDTVYSMKKETPKTQTSNLKQKQLDIVKSANPMTDDYHTGIRSVKDIKSFEETLNDDESFTYGDFTKEDALKAVEKGEVKVYSSKPIANGGFVSTSYNMAKDYAGSGKVYSETVPLTDVAWINGDEGQLARVGNKETVETINSRLKDSNIKAEDKYLSKYNNVSEILNNQSSPINYEINEEYLKNGEISKEEAKDLARKSYFDNNKGAAYNNGKKILVSNADIAESINKIYRNPQQTKLIQEHLLVMKHLNEIIKKAEKVNQNIEQKKSVQKTHERNVLWTYYLDGVKINNKDYKVVFDVVSRNDGENHYRLQRLEEINKEGSQLETASKEAAPPFHREPSVNNSIQQNNKSVNTEYAQDTQNDTKNSNKSSFNLPENAEDIYQFKSSENGKPYMDLNGHISMDNNSNVERVGLSQIEKAINDIVTTKVGKFRQKAYGIYKNGAEIIRLKEKNDVPVALHELTHHLDKKYGLSDLGKFDDELMNIAVADKNATRNTKIAEGVAEFGRYYMTDKEYAKFIAPKYYEAFEEALAKEPEMKNNVEKLQQMVSDYLNQSPLNRMASHIDFGDEEASLWQKSKSKISEFKKNFRKNFVDELDPMKKIVNDITNGKKLNVEEDPTELMRLLNGVTGKVRVALEYGIVDDKGNKVGKSLKEIINPVANNMEEFIAYTSALRARDLANNNMESGFNPKDVDEIIKLYQNNTTFNKAAKELYKFQNDILEKTLVDSGIITKEAMEAYNKNNPHYVPFYRVMDENFKQGKDSLSKKPKKIKGSTRDIINPIESIIKNTYSYTLIAEKNKIYKTLFDMAKKYDGTGKWFDKVPTDMVGETVSAKDVKDILEKLNLDREDIDYNEVFTTIFKPSYNQKGNIITVMEKGKPVHYEINDKELYDILAPAYNNKKEGFLTQFLYKGASALRVGATHSLEFVFRNPLRDTFTAGAFSENGFIPLVDTIRGIFEVVGKSDLYYKWLEGGGSGSTYTNAQRTTLKNTLKDILPEAARKNNSTMEKTLDILLNTTKHPLRTYLDVVGNISNIMEEGTRLGEFRRAYNKTNSIKKSALDSRDITVDFSRGGIEGKEWNRKVAFLNANIQGLDKTIRSFKDRPFATSMKVLAMLTIPSILIRLLQDPDDMDKIAQWEKDTYWVFYINGVPIKIPKPQGPIQMFATLPERVIDFIRAKDSHAFDGLIERTISSSSPIDGFSSILPTAWQPLIETVFNYSIFRQQPIVKQSLQGRSPKYQYDENTSTIAKMVGGATNTSPKKIDNLVSGYFGNLGKDAVNIAGLPIDMVNLLVNGTGKKKEYNNLNSTLRKLPLIKGFVANDTHSKALDNFYDEKSRVSTAYTDAKFVYGDHPTSEQSKELEQLKELNSKYNKTYNEIKKINEQIDNVKQSNYSNKQKESMINISKEEIDKKAKDLEKETEELKKSIKRLK